MGTAVAFHQHPATDQCPWCGTGISRSKFLEIQSRIAEGERKKLAVERARMQTELGAALKKAEARMKQEADKKVSALTAERDAAAAKVKQYDARVASIRKEAERQTELRVKTEFEKKMDALTTQRDEAAAKIKLLEAAKQKELQQQRSSLEKDRDGKLLKAQVQYNREREQLQQKIDALTRQLQRKTSDELGEGAEVDVYDALREAFPRDEISRIKRGQPGADIRHQVLQKGISCGSILIDSKNRQGWQNSYVTKLREDQMAAKADYAILATTVFPSGRRELYVDEDTRVIVVNRARAVEIAGLVRHALQRIQSLELSQSERSEKRELLYAYITSEDYRQHLIEAGRLTGELAELDVDEKRAHDKVWEKRGKVTTRLRNVVREVDTEVTTIVEGRRSR
jgi:hypothetical protein